MENHSSSQNIPNNFIQIESSQENYNIKNMYCFNPRCQHPTSRMFNYQCNNYEKQSENIFTLTDHKHQKCTQWLIDIATLQKSEYEIKYQNYQKEQLNGNGKKMFDLKNIDFLAFPIKSILQLYESTTHLNWKRQIINFYQKLQEDLHNKISLSCNATLEKVSHIISDVQNLYYSMQNIAINQLQFTTESQCKEEEQHLFKMLLHFEEFGKFESFQEDFINNNFRKIEEIIQDFEQHIWSTQNQQQKTTRKESIKTQQQIKQHFNMHNLNNMIEINYKLQELQSLYGCLPPKLITNNNESIYIQCWHCNQRIYDNNGRSIKERRNYCQTMLLQHLLSKHFQVIKQKYIKKNNKKGLEISYKQFLNEIQHLKPQQTVIIIDRQNLKAEVPEQPNTYILEVVSRHGIPAARGKYLLASSDGKDAADILIILCLYELSTLRTNTIKKIILLTNDHYGETLQPIFKNNIGRNIQCRKNYQSLIQDSENINVQNVANNSISQQK